jgi:2-polyprenyl-3-methyl-5-hydroxy-6-metoxy-1,4-benzoquinol methylase
MLSLHARAFGDEIMDGSDYLDSEYGQTLRELEWINRFTNGYAPTLSAVKKTAELAGGRKIRILDIGYGYGDTLRRIYRWAKAQEIEVELHGIDLNPQAKRWAQSATPPDYQIDFRVGNAFDLRDEKFDLVINALMMHHLDDAKIVKLLRWMTANATLAWFINDLHRHPLAFYFTKLMAPILGFGRLVKNDAPLSIAKSFTSAEWRRYLGEAGVPDSAVSLRWHWAFRYGVFCRSEDARRTLRMNE